MHFFTEIVKTHGLDQPTVDNGGVSRGRSVAMAVGCWHFNVTSMALHGTSMSLQRHFNGTSMAHHTALQLHFKNKNNIDKIMIMIWYC